MGILALPLLVALSGVRCAQDLFVSPKSVSYVFTVTPDSAVLNVGDTVAPFTATLTADGKAVAHGLRVTVLQGIDVVRSESGGRVIVLRRGLARLKVEPQGVALPPGLPADTVPAWAVAPRIRLSTARSEDTVVSLHDTLWLEATPLTSHGAPISGARVSWRQVSGAGVVSLLDSALGTVRAETNGTAEFEASIDTAHARRVVRVAQQPHSLTNTVDTTVLNAIGHTHLLGTVVRDARANLIVGAAPDWQSKNTAVATVCCGGTVTAQGEGATIVIASITGVGLAVADTTTVMVRRMRLAIASGNGLAGTVGAPLTAPLVVQVVDSTGAALADSDIAVVFKVTGGGGQYGTADSVVVATDGQGRAQATPTLGPAPGSNTFTASGPGLAGGAVTFTASGAPGRRLKFTVEPTTIVAGGSIVPAPNVEVLDSFGNRVISATDSVTLAITPGTGIVGAKVAGTAVVAAVSGVAAFGAVTVDKVGNGYTLTASASGLIPDTSAVFNVGSGTPDHLAFKVPPRAAQAGVPITPAVQVAVADATGNVVTTSTLEVTLSIGRVPQGGSGNYFGTPGASAVGGVAVFNDFGIQTAASGYKLKAAASGLLPILSDLFDASGPPATLQLVSGNSQGDTVRAVLRDSLVVRVLDASGVGVPSDTVVFRVTAGGGSFGGVDSLLVVTAAGGRAAAALRLGSTTGTDSVTARSRSLAGQSAAFAATAVEAGLHLEFIAQPATIILGSAFSSPVQVRVRDGFMHTVTGATSIVTLAVTPGTGRTGAALTGTAAVAAVNGVAAFTGLGVSRSGTGYTLTATASSVSPATSAAFDVQQVATTLVKDWGDNQNGTVGAGLLTNLAVLVLDAASDPVVGDTVIYKVTAGPGSFGGVDSTIGVTDGWGRAVARVGLTLGATPGMVTISARSTHLAGQSVTFRTSATAAGRALEFVTQPSTIVSGTTFAPSVQVRVFDPGSGTTDATAVTLIALTPSGAMSLLGTKVAAAVNGVATFADLGVTAPLGPGYRLDASAQGVMMATSNSFDIIAGAPARLVFNQAPAHLVAGQWFGVQVLVLDANGNIVPGATTAITLAISGGTGTAGAHLSGTLTFNAVGGAATVGGFMIDSAGSGYTLTASAAGLASAVTAAFDVVPAPATRLIFLVQPSAVTAGVPMSPAVNVLIQDALGNVVTSSNVPVTLTLGTNPGTVTSLLGTTSVAAVGGIASFTDLRVRFARSGNTLVAVSPGLPSATSASFDVVAAPASRLLFTAQPGNVLPGATIVPSPQVTVQDSIGNVVTSSNATVGVQITAGSGTTGATLAGTTTAGVVNGVASFAGLSIATAGYNYTLTASAGGLASAVSAPFSIVTAASNRLVFKQLPAQLVAGAPAVVTVAVEDGSGTRASGFTGNVTLAITEGTGTVGAHLRGTSTVAAVAGLATLSISVDSAGTGYSFTATAAGVASGTSAGLAVDPAPAVRLEWRVQPTSRTAGNVFTPAIQVVVRDSLGNLARATPTDVTLAITPGTGASGATLDGTTTLSSSSSGFVAFADLSIAKAGTGYTLTASATGLPSIVGNTFSIVVGTVSRVVVTPDAASLSGFGATRQFAAQAFDRFDNPVSGAAISWYAWGYDVATIDAATGVLTARSAGQAVIGASSGDGMGTAVATVSVPEALPVNLWVRMPSGTSSDLYAVKGSSSMYAAGQSGTVLYLAPITGWTSLASGTTASLSGVWVMAPSNAVVSGSGGTVRATGDVGANWQTRATGLSEHLSAVWGASWSDLFVVGQGGTVLRSHGGGMEQMTSGVAGWLRAIYGTSASNVVAVGENGTVVRFDGAAWTPMAIPTTQHLNAVWGTSASSMYAAGEGVYHWDGSAWSLMSGSPAANGIWGASDRDIYTVSQSGSIWRYDGTAWAKMVSGSLTNLNGIWGTSSGDVYAVGEGGTILRGVRGARVVVTPESQTLTALGATVRLTAQARAPGNLLVDGVAFTWTSSNPAAATVDSTGVVTAVGNGGTTITATAPGGASAGMSVTVSQVAKTLVVSPAGASVSGVGSTQTFTVTGQDSLGHPVANPGVYWSSLNPNVATVSATGVATAVAAGQVTISAAANGLTAYGLLTVAVDGPAPDLFAYPASGTTAFLHGVWGASPTDVFAVGDNGVILHWNGANWTPRASGTTEHLYGVWGTSPTNVFAVGHNGTILRYDGATWTPMASGTTQELQDVWGASPTDVYAVGTIGTVLHFDGTSWTAQAIGATYTFNGVWGTSRTNVYASAGGGNILHYDGTTWAAMASGTAEPLQDVWGTSPTDVFATNGYGRFRHWDGYNWIEQDAGTPNWLGGVWGTSPRNVYGVAGLGTIVRFDGTNWAPLATGTTTLDFTRVWAASPTLLVAVGSQGATVLGISNATVTVTPASPTLTSLGATQQLTAAARDASSNPVPGVTYAWSSSNPSIASVDPATGVVTAVANGTATVTATAPGGAAGSQTVTVSQVAKAVAVSPRGASLSGVGAAQTFTVTAQDSLGHAIASPSVTWASRNPNLATVSGGGVVTAVGPGQATIAASSGSAVGYAVVTVAIPGMTPVNLWVPMASGTTQGLSGVWGTSGSDVFAVGGNSILHYDGTSWSTVFSDYRFGFMDVWGSSSADVHAVGAGGTTVHYNGTFWSVRQGGTSGTLAAVWGASPADIYAVSWDSAIVRYDGTSWRPMSGTTMLSLEGVWGTSASDVYANGQQHAFHYDGTSWSDMSTGVTKFIKDIWGFSAADIFAAGLGNVFHYGGTSWTQILYDAPIEVRAIWGSAGTDMYFAGARSGGQAAVAHYDGSAWTMMDNLTPQHLEAIWGSPSGNVFAVGGAGTILQGYRGATVAVTPTNPTIAGIGNTQQLAATVKDVSNNTISGVTFTWSSGNPAVATVDSSGLVTTVAAGSVTITATAPGGASASTNVTVNP